MSTERIEHRRGTDGELVGWIDVRGDGFVAVDLLGRERTSVVDWLEAEDTLDALGLGYLAEPYGLLRDDGSLLRVRIAEVRPDVIRVKEDDGGDMTAPQVFFTLPLPVPHEALRELRR